MHIQQIKIENVRNVRLFEWSLGEGELAGWHVLLGDNGSGKSTILKAISLALVGPENAHALRQDWAKWVYRGVKSAIVTLEMLPHKDYDKADGQPLKNYKASIQIKEDDGLYTISRSSSSRLSPTWKKKTGWFSVAYGPFRRFGGGNPENVRLFAYNPRLAAFLSVFGEDVALSETIVWLIDLHTKQLENRREGKLLDAVRKFMSQDDFLPHQAKLQEISSSGVFFEDANGNSITVENLSDGYRSILSMTFEIIRQLQAIYDTDDLFNEDYTQIKMPGVVLIDEIDAHLHPTWQKRVGHWFRQHFPQMQFIVTTHSPFVCQAVSSKDEEGNVVEQGSVWRLPKPGTEEKVTRIKGIELDRLIYGDILEAYSTQLFGLDETRSKIGQELQKELAELNLKEIFADLKPDEIERQRELRAMLPTSANNTPEEA